jgi:multidrug resistance efflux pump
MFRRYLLPGLSIGGVLLAIYAVQAGNREVVPSSPASSPASAPFPSYVAGAGLVEASTENIAISPLVPGVVTKVYVQVGERVKAGDPLFAIDDRVERAEVEVRAAALERARQSLQRLRMQPRAEDLPPLRARVQEAEAAVSNARREQARLDAIPEQAIARDERERARLAVEVTEAQLAAAKAELARVEAGAWEADIAIAESEIASAEAQLRAAQAALDRLTVRAPVDGTVLQARVRVGEFAAAGNAGSPLMLLGDIDTLHVRVDVDENDAWRLRPNARARAFLRGNSEMATDVRFVRVEPYVIPKRNLSGDSTERVDTRVLQVLFAFDRRDLPAYVGQQMDVFIESEAIAASTRTAAR